MGAIRGHKRRIERRRAREQSAASTPPETDPDATEAHTFGTGTPSADTTQDETFVLDRQERITFPSTGRESWLAIRKSDWRRIRRRVSRATSRTEKLPVIYSILFGVAGSSGLSIIPIASTEDLPSWVTAVYVCVCVFGFLSGCVFVWFDNKNQSEKQSELQHIQEDMEEIHPTE